MAHLDCHRAWNPVCSSSVQSHEGQGREHLPQSGKVHAAEKKKLDVGVHRELVRVRPHCQFDVLLLFMLYYPVYCFAVKYWLQEGTVAFHLFIRFPEACGQLCDSKLAPPLGAHLKNVFVYRVTDLLLFPDAFETSCQDGRKRKVRVARWVRCPEFYSFQVGKLVSLVMRRDPDYRRSVAGAPRNINRRLIAGHKPPVRVGCWCYDRC